MKELLIGCGHSREKRLFHPADNGDWHDLVTLDINPDLNPDVVHDLNNLPYPFPDNEFGEIHAYEVLEHCGRQGDWRFFFDQWTEFARIIKPDGLFFGSCPDIESRWAWGDPGHARIISPESLTFLDQAAYEAQTGGTSLCDYRTWYKADWKLVWQGRHAESQCFALRCIKPDVAS